MEKLIITAAICGAEVTKEQNPAVPYTVEEIVREAKSDVDAGAAIVHLHVRENKFWRWLFIVFYNFFFFIFFFNLIFVFWFLLCFCMTTVRRLRAKHVSKRV